MKVITNLLLIKIPQKMLLLLFILSNVRPGNVPPNGWYLVEIASWLEAKLKLNVRCQNCISLSDIREPSSGKFQMTTDNEWRWLFSNCHTLTCSLLCYTAKISVKLRPSHRTSPERDSNSRLWYSSYLISLENLDQIAF